MLYEQTVPLAHLKPHRPLIRPTVTNVTNHIHTMIRNNLKFNCTVHLKNKMVRPGFMPLIHMGENTVSPYYTEMPFERYGLDMSEYEWFLHTSRLKEVYRKQKQFIRIMERRQTGQSEFLKIFENNSRLDVYSPLSWNQTAPAVYYVTQKREQAPAPAHTQITKTENTVQENTYEQGQSIIKVENNTVYKSVNVDDIVDRVAKTMAEKLNIDRLKKGR